MFGEKGRLRVERFSSSLLVMKRRTPPDEELESPESAVRGPDYAQLGVLCAALLCPLCRLPLRCPTTLACGHSLCSRHVTDPPGLPSGQPAVPSLLPLCPLPDCYSSPILRSFHSLCFLTRALPARTSHRPRRSPRTPQDRPRTTARCLPQQSHFPPPSHKTGTRRRLRVRRRQRATSQATQTSESRRRWRQRSPCPSTAPGNPAPHHPPRRASSLPIGSNEGLHLVPLPEGAACGAYLRNMLRPSLSTDNHPLSTCKTHSPL